jgi:hypothetical protein
MSGAGAAAKVVDQASIHAQFSMLQAERDQLRCQVVSLDRNRRQEEQALMTLRQTYQRLGQELRVANDTLGGLNNKRQALENEYERLRQLHNFEKKELMGLTEEMEERYRIEQNDKQAFVTELDGVNAKMDRSIRAYEEFKARESITADAISALLKEPSMQKDTNLLPKVEEQLVELRSVEAKVMTFQEEHAEHCRQVTALRQEALNEAHEHGQVSFHGYSKVIRVFLAYSWLSSSSCSFSARCVSFEGFGRSRID